MFAEGRSCVELAQQLEAVESIIHATKRTLIQVHMEHCIGDAVGDGGMSARQALAEFKALSKYL
jgi:DNA-binding FrmR family transcriptional regulator